MCRRRVILVVAPVIFCCACQLADQREAAPATTPKAATDARMEELKYSAFCTDASAKFWSRHDWKDQHDISQMTSYTSHYNRKLNKCVVDVHGISLLSGQNKVTESDHVYDAIEDTVLGGRVTLRKGGPDGEVEGVVMVKDSRVVRDEREKAAFVPWFQSLMVE